MEKTMMRREFLRCMAVAPVAAAVPAVAGAAKLDREANRTGEVCRIMAEWSEAWRQRIDIGQRFGDDIYKNDALYATYRRKIEPLMKIISECEFKVYELHRE